MSKVRFFKTIQEATKNNNYNGIIETIFVADITKEKVEKLISGINQKPHLVDTALTFL